MCVNVGILRQNGNGFKQYPRKHIYCVIPRCNEGLKFYNNPTIFLCRLFDPLVQKYIFKTFRSLMNLANVMYLFYKVIVSIYFI